MARRAAAAACARVTVNMRSPDGQSVTATRTTSATPPLASQIRSALAPSVSDRLGAAAVGSRGIAAGGAQAAFRSSGASVRPAPHLERRPEHDPQRHQRQRHDHELLEPDARRLRDEDRQREPDDVEGEVQDDAGQQAEVEVQQPEANRRDDQLDRPRVRRLVRDTARARRRRPTACTTKPITMNRRRWPNRSPMSAAPAIGTARNSALFPEARLERVRDRRQPRRVGRQHVGMEQRLGRATTSRRRWS